MTDFIQSARAATPVPRDCLGRTCLQWRADGELTALDLRLVLERLALVDPEVTALHVHSPERQPCPSIR
jgi:hypothetical protein